MLYPIIILLILSFISEAAPAAAGASAENWRALHGEDRELSIELPAACSRQIFVRDGFELYDRSLKQRHRVRELRSVSCYENKTLLSVDVYAADLPAAVLRLMQTISPEKGDKSELPAPLDGVRFVRQDEKVTAERRFIAGRRHLYVLTAAVRAGGPDETLKRFLNSVRVRPADEARNADGEQSKPLSSLPEFVPELIVDAGEKDAGEKDAGEKDAAPQTAPTRAPQTAPEPVKTSIVRPLVLHKVTAGWPRAAARAGVGGEVRLRLIFGPAGNVSKIEVLRDPGGGLVREAVLAVLQSKVLPGEIKDAARASEMTIAYQFMSR